MPVVFKESPHGTPPGPLAKLGWILAAVCALVICAKVLRASPTDPTYQIVLLTHDLTPAEGRAVADIVRGNPDAVIVVARCEDEGGDSGPSMCNVNGQPVEDWLVKSRAAELFEDREIILVLVVPDAPEGPPPEGV